MTELAFLFIGGVHQVAHLAPVAAEISRLRRDLAVRCICADPVTAGALKEVQTRMEAPGMAVTELAVPLAGVLLARLTGRQSAAKGPLLAAIRWNARNAAAIIVPERTSAALRRLGWRRPLIHFRHGAGDRAPSSEKRLKAFDLIVVPGQKDVDRAVSQGINQARLRSVGYIKADYFSQVARSRPPLFDNDRPVVLYNPHFDPRISSLGIAAEVLERFRAQERYNLIYAPHVRATENLSARERAAWMALEVPEQVLVDLGSPRLFDMSYLFAADAYLGDMSSQLYEFLVVPRPVAFIDAHSADWQSDRRYAGWSLGEVARGADGALDAIDRAFETQRAQAPCQAEAVKYALGDCQGAIERAAALILSELNL